MNNLPLENIKENQNKKRVFIKEQLVLDEIGHNNFIPNLSILNRFFAFHGGGCSSTNSRL